MGMDSGVGLLIFLAARRSRKDRMGQRTRLFDRCGGGILLIVVLLFLFLMMRRRPL